MAPSVLTPLCQQRPPSGCQAARAGSGVRSRGSGRAPPGKDRGSARADGAAGREGCPPARRATVRAGRRPLSATAGAPSAPARGHAGRAPKPTARSRHPGPRPPHRRGRSLDRPDLAGDAGPAGRPGERRAGARARYLPSGILPDLGRVVPCHRLRVEAAGSRRHGRNSRSPGRREGAAGPSPGGHRHPDRWCSVVYRGGDQGRTGVGRARGAGRPLRTVGTTTPASGPGDAPGLADGEAGSGLRA